MIDWRESNLQRRPRAFEALHVVVRLVAIVTGGVATQIASMACVGLFTPHLLVRVVVGAAITLAIPAIATWILYPKGDPLIALNLPSETFAVTWVLLGLGFAVAAPRWTGAILTREADREAAGEAPHVARVTYFLAGVTPVAAR